MPALAVCASEAVCTVYPCFSSTQRKSFTFISLSSTMRMHPPATVATLRLLGYLPPRQEGVQLPQEGGGTIVSLHHDGLGGLAQARLVVFGEILHRPDDHGRAPPGLRHAEALEEFESVESRHDQVEDHRDERRFRG